MPATPCPAEHPLPSDSALEAVHRELDAVCAHRRPRVLRAVGTSRGVAPGRGRPGTSDLALWTVRPLPPPELIVEPQDDSECHARVRAAP
jgi:hypothetical protein